MIDQRVGNAEKIIPEDPLPYVSRKALKRVKNPLPVPKECPYCEGAVELVENSAIYNGKLFGDWPYAYLCKPCDAYVGLHPDTDVPLGTLANKGLRDARKKAKANFHELMEMTHLGRSGSYEWLAEKMGILVGDCHFGWFNESQCEYANDICYKEITKKVNF